MGAGGVRAGAGGGRRRGPSAGRERVVLWPDQHEAAAAAAWVHTAGRGLARAHVCVCVVCLTRSATHCSSLAQLRSAASARYSASRAGSAQKGNATEEECQQEGGAQRSCGAGRKQPGKAVVGGGPGVGGRGAWARHVEQGWQTGMAAAHTSRVRHSEHTPLNPFRATAELH